MVEVNLRYPQGLPTEASWRARSAVSLPPRPGLDHLGHRNVRGDAPRWPQHNSRLKCGHFESEDDVCLARLPPARFYLRM